VLKIVVMYTVLDFTLLEVHPFILYINYTYSMYSDDYRKILKGTNPDAKKCLPPSTD